MSLEYTICCDRCGRLIVAAKSTAQARREVRELGGRTRYADGGDICNFCVADEQPSRSGAIGTPREDG